MLDKLTQNERLLIRLVSPEFGQLPPGEKNKYGHTQRRNYYFFMFMIHGSARHLVDLEHFEVYTNQLLFVLPNQVHEMAASHNDNYFFKIGFDESCLSLLPKQYSFLINPLNSQSVSFKPAAAVRVKSIFEILLGLLSEMNTAAELILAHLNSLLAEINNAYFFSEIKPADQNLAKYIDFKLFVENNLTDHPTITKIADELTVNTNSLYKIVKQYSGLSPKEFITNRLILEARRRLYYGESTSIKELAFELGFNDPEYFSRLFKKITGKTIAAFYQDLSGK